MKKLLITSIFLVMAATLAACSATPVRRSVKETWNDTRTATKIRYKMMRDGEVKKSHMHVTVFRSQVTLTGRAMTDAEKARAEAVAKSVKRVTGVENYVHVVGGGDNAKAAPAVATVIETDKIKVATPQGKTVAIEEKTLKEVPLTEVALPVTTASSVPTIRMSTGQPAPKAAAPKTVAAKAAPKLVPKTVAPKATAKVALPQSSVPMTTTAVTPVSPVPQSKVVGQSKTGLPWDGEVYEDDASKVTPVAKAPVATPPSTTATTGRSPVKTQAPSQPSPAASTPVPAGDDLAKEAAAELEKLRQKK